MDLYGSINRKEKISELVFQQIKNSIINGMVKPGHKLPSERELVKQFEASRIAVREGLCALEAAGLITIKRGAGIFVNKLSSKTVTDSLFSILQLEKTSINAVTQARVVFEPSVARLAAEKAEQEDIEMLQASISEAESIHNSSKPSKLQPPATYQNIKFHSLVAQATHNNVIHLTMSPLFDVLNEMTKQLNIDNQKRAEISKRSTAYHKKILQALRNKDANKAYEYMLQDVMHVQGGFREIGTKRSNDR